MTSATRSIRALGTVMGAAIGDALGAPLEFKSMGEPSWTTAVKSPVQDFMAGGPFSLKAGQITDDTHMACCLADSLRVHGGLVLDDVAERYLAWRKVTFDCGGMTSASLREFGRTRDATLCGQTAWEAGGFNGAGNGSLMRASPIGAYFEGDMEGCLIASMWDAQVTHYDPRCVLACAAYNSAICAAVSHPEAITRDSMVESARLALDEARRYWADKFDRKYLHLVDQAREALLTDLDFSEKKDPGLYSSNLHLQHHQGFVRVGFRLAFWALQHSSDYEGGILNVVNRGGDSDTNGAIAGGLLGSYYAIPGNWERNLLECDPAGAFGQAGLYHPATLKAMVASMDFN